MTTSEPYHVGIVVTDIEAAIEDYSRSHGWTFLTPVTRTHQMHDHLSGWTGLAELTVTYSTPGPFRIELIAAVGPGIYSEARAGGIHHLGVWESDIEERHHILLDEGAEIDAVFRGADDRVSAIYARPFGASDGARMEYVSGRVRERLERWFATDGLAHQTAATHGI